jgi:hypothetical protein
LLNKALLEDPQLEPFLESLPWRVFSAKSVVRSTPGIFACYRLAHIRSHDLETRKSVTMAQGAGGQLDTNKPQLLAWMDVAPIEGREAITD